MRAFLLAATALLGLGGTAFADQQLPARLAGHAVLPAFTMALPPADAPRFRRIVHLGELGPLLDGIE